MSSETTRSFSLQGRVALVTGASGALGAHFARTLARAGAAVVLAARRVEPMHGLQIELARAGAHAVVVPMDVTDTASITRAFDRAEAEGGAIDLVINNSGIAEPGASLDQADEDWQRLFAVNLGGVRNVSVEAVRRMVAAKRGGAIVNVASILGLRQGSGVTAYATSKAALIQLTRQHALEWARYGIRVNALAPGYIETDLNQEYFKTDAGAAMVKRIPQRRLGRVENLEGPLLLLASDAGSFMTGSVVVVDGGHLLSTL